MLTCFPFLCNNIYSMPLTNYAYTFILKSQSFNECCKPLMQKQAYNGNPLWLLPTCNGLNTFTWVITLLWKRPWSKISLRECLWELPNKCRCARWCGFNGLWRNTQLQRLQLTSPFDGVQIITQESHKRGVFSWIMQWGLTD